jgi:lon-related putative ATP-dependent protease
MGAESTIAAALTPEQLTRACDPAQFAFETTAELTEPAVLIGQPRAQESLDLGLAVTAAGYNLYVAGPVGTGKTTFTLHRLTERAAGQPVPPDWCYVFNFADPYRPQAIALPPGQGGTLAAAMRELVAACRREIPRAFEGEPYEQRRRTLLTAVEEQRRGLLTTLEQQAHARGFAIQVAPMGIVTIPLVLGRPVSHEEFERLPEAQRAAIEAKGEELRADINHFLAQARRLEKQATEQVGALDQEIARFVIAPLVAEVREQFPGQARLQAYLDQVERDLGERLDLLRAGDGAPAGGLPWAPSAEDLVARYAVNVVVDNGGLAGAPVVIEHNPTYYNLTGRIDYAARFGGMITDHRFVKAGAVQRASGGYLVVQARDLLGAPLAWEALKRALRTGQVAPENLGEQYSPFPTATLKPDPIPVTPKIVIVGDRLLYQLLYLLDPDFQVLFRARADFDVVMPRTAENEHLYARFLAQQMQAARLPPVERAAVARIVEYGARLAGHQGKLSTRFNDVLNLGIEAGHWATQAGRAVVTAADVERAVAHRTYRSNLVEERLRDLMAEGTVLIATAGAVVGQINGLSVIDLGDYAFGHPSRITARVAPGSAGVVNIERETRQSGPAHSKGVLTLAGYLLGQYAAEAPLALSASLGFEQMYEAVDGDSAAAAELYALLSALAEAALRQDLAVTGSVNQRGQIQAIGGVNEKVEGFFAICRQAGLTGTQGVIIPRPNVRHLMLPAELVEAVRQGTFHIYAIATVDEGLALLTGLEAGQRAADGHYLAATLHGRVAARLSAFVDRLARLRVLATGNGLAPAGAQAGGAQG